MKQETQGTVSWKGQSPPCGLLHSESLRVTAGRYYSTDRRWLFNSTNSTSMPFPLRLEKPCGKDRKNIRVKGTQEAGCEEHRKQAVRNTGSRPVRRELLKTASRIVHTAASDA